jgi:TPR repeat protein
MASSNTIAWEYEGRSMAKSKFPVGNYEDCDGHLPLVRAYKQWDAGELRSAFRLFLTSAKSGDPSAQNALATFYSDGIGMKPNRARAFYWYERAYRKGDLNAAHNLGIMFRDEGNSKQALEWFERAVKLRDTDSNLDIAKIHIEKKELKEAARYLKKILTARQDEVTEASREEAQRLLEGLE